MARNLADAFFISANTCPELVAYDQALADTVLSGGPREYRVVLKAQMKQRVLQLAQRFESWGVQPQETIAIVSLERPEWIEAELAAYTVGARVTAAYVRDSLECLRHVLIDSAAKYVVVENQQQFDRVRDLLEQCGPHSAFLQIRGMLCIESVDVAPARLEQVRLATFHEVFAEPCERHESSFAYVRVPQDAIATFYYTSGSTGLPKGVPVTHRQSLENLRQIAAARLVDYSRWEGNLSGEEGQPYVTCILPEHAHAYPARTAQLTATSPARARYPAIVDRRESEITPAYRSSVRRDLREAGAGVVLVVPKILMLMHHAVRQGMLQGNWFERCAMPVVEIAARKLLCDARGQPNFWLSLLCKLLEPLRRRVAGRVRSEIVGPKFEFFISGGARLPMQTAAFLKALDLEVYEGYGTTETNCPVAVNLAHAHRMGTVGRPLPGVEISIDPDSGELLVRGPNVAGGYWNLNQATADAWTADGWYRTGDAGTIDADGFVSVANRLDEKLVLLNGENVWSCEVENRFAAIDVIDTVVAIGHQRPAIVALIALKEPAVRDWARRNGHRLSQDWFNHPAVHTFLSSEIASKVNVHVRHSCESVRSFAVIETPSIEQGTLTATEKINKHEVATCHANLIEELYRNTQAWLPAA